MIGRRGDLLLNDRAVRDAAGGRHALRQRLALARRLETGHRNRALCARVDDAVRALELSEKQRPAHQRRRVAERRDRYVDTRSGLDAGRQIRRDDDRRDIPVAQLDAMHIEAKVLQHSLDGLLGERRVAKRVARALQADHEPIADELAVPSAAQNRNVLDASRRGRRGNQKEHQRDD